MVGGATKLTITSSAVLPQPLLTVHRKVYVSPAVPVKVAVGEAVLEKLPPFPEILLQVPVPTEGLVAFKVVVPHWLKASGPALATEGWGEQPLPPPEVKLTFISSKVLPQALLTVKRRV